MVLFYNIAIRLYAAAIGLVAGWNKKARQWVDGRKDWAESLREKIVPGERYIWMHCSSAGEFEQGKPIAEALKQEYPRHKLLLSFFSPSGYAVAGNYRHADVICYLPLDTHRNAQEFLQLVQPELAVFIKYEFWYHHLSVAAAKGVPLLLVSAVFRPGQLFFKPYGRFFKRMLQLFQHIFVQDDPSLQLLKAAGIDQCSISGDTRFDRVAAIAQDAAEVPFIESFKKGQHTVVAGSTWPDDENLLASYLGENPEVKCIIAPHEVNERHIRQLQVLFPQSILYTTVRPAVQAAVPVPAIPVEKLAAAQILIIDCVGLLSRLYRHASIAYVGGGFTRDGIHNILEAAVWGKPVVFGSNYKKYREAFELIAAGGGFSIATGTELKKLADDWFENQGRLQAVSEKAMQYVRDNTGATGKVLHYLQEKRLLTRL